MKGLHDSSVGKEPACNAGDPGSIPGLGRSPGKGIGYPFQYSWASLVVQLLKNPPAMWETWIQSLHGEDPLKKGMANHSNILPWRIPWTVSTKLPVKYKTFQHGKEWNIILLCLHQLSSLAPLPGEELVI